MTKYVLHGGDTRFINPDNDSYYKEMTVGLTGKLTIILNYFPREDHEYEKLAEEDEKRFLENSENKDLVFEIAKPDTLGEQLKRADIMYIRGGSTDKLLGELKQTKNLEQLFQDKVIAGSSAGTYALVKYYYGNDTKKVQEGLGIINVKSYCHYKVEDSNVIKQLAGYKEILPLLILPDYKWQVFYK